MHHADRRTLRGRLLDLVVGAAGVAVLSRVAAGGLAEVMARCLYGGGAPVKVSFVEGRYGLVPLREAEIHDLPESSAFSSGLGRAA